MSTGWCKTHQPAMLTESLPEVSGQIRRANCRSPGVWLYPGQVLGQGKRAGQRQHGEPSGGKGVCRIMPWPHKGSQLKRNQQCHTAVHQSAVEEQVYTATHLSSAQQHRQIGT